MAESITTTDTTPVAVVAVTSDPTGLKFVGNALAAIFLTAGFVYLYTNAIVGIAYTSTL